MLTPPSEKTGTVLTTDTGTGTLSKTDFNAQMNKDKYTDLTIKKSVLWIRIGTVCFFLASWIRIPLVRFNRKTLIHTVLFCNLSSFKK
jgi:hypothetical protein